MRGINYFELRCVLVVELIILWFQSFIYTSNVLVMIPTILLYFHTANMYLHLDKATNRFKLFLTVHKSVVVQCDLNDWFHVWHRKNFNIHHETKNVYLYHRNDFCFMNIVEIFHFWLCWKLIFEIFWQNRKRVVHSYRDT